MMMIRFLITSEVLDCPTYDIHAILNSEESAWTDVQPANYPTTILSMRTRSRISGYSNICWLDGLSCIVW